MVVGWLVLLQAVPLSRPAVMRRIMMGAGLTVSLFVTTVLAAGLVGQPGSPTPGSPVWTSIVLAVGSGAALSLGVVMGFVFKADDQWSPEDDRAVQQALARELDPDLAGDTVRSLGARPQFGVRHDRHCQPASRPPCSPSRVPWLACPRGGGCRWWPLRSSSPGSRADRSGLRVFAAGILRVMDVPAAAISAATPRTSRAADYGGWGYRSHGGTAAMLVSSGPAVVVPQNRRPRLAVSGGSPAPAAQLAEVLTRVAARPAATRAAAGDADAQRPAAPASDPSMLGSMLT